jgi:hypothetical protein
MIIAFLPSRVKRVSAATGETEEPLLTSQTLAAVRVLLLEKSSCGGNFARSGRLCRNRKKDKVPESRLNRDV